MSISVSYKFLPRRLEHSIFHLQGRINHMAEAAYAAGPAHLAILGAPGLIPKKLYK